MVMFGAIEISLATYLVFPVWRHVSQPGGFDVRRGRGDARVDHAPLFAGFRFHSTRGHQHFGDAFFGGVEVGDVTSSPTRRAV